MSNSAVFSCRAALASFAGRYDIVHLHGSFWWSVAGAFGARARHRPFITKVTRLGEDDPETVMEKRWGRLPLGRLYRAPITTANAVVALSNEIVARCQNRGVQAQFIPNGVDVDVFQPADELTRRKARSKFDLPLEGFHLLHSGYLVPHKGVMTLVEAWNASAGWLPAGSVLILAGPFDGFYRELSDEFSAELRRAAASNPSIRLLGYVDPADMSSLYASASAFALLSEREGMPNSVLEALASGLSIIATDIPGVRELISGLSSASLVPTIDPVAATTEIIRLVSRTDAETAQHSVTSRRHAVENYSLTALSQRYLELYLGLLSRTNA